MVLMTCRSDLEPEAAFGILRRQAQAGVARPHFTDVQIRNKLTAPLIAELLEMPIACKESSDCDANRFSKVVSVWTFYVSPRLSALVVSKAHATQAAGLGSMRAGTKWKY